MANIRKISWRRILVEGAVIMVSILLAFSIDAWWNNRIEQQRERQQLISMRAEFQASLSGLDEVLSSVQGHAKNVESLIALLKAAGDEPVLIPGPLLGSAITWRTSDVSISTLDALMASGDLNLLHNVELRANLAGLPAYLQNVTEDEISVLSSPELIGFLTARRVHFWYSEIGLPEVRSYLEMLIKQIDNELGPNK